ncbi:hypothetical protein K7957_07505 [Sphingomonas yunnanensis]|uniref:hypothetical protein n=1 Tax=Sphingomonas yunnanensis TaxID=310400 RepID=UPI001CA6D0B8|nr:hypothetical protein [Sphingomonas yunnanensis]MBY9062775.1 hypothetical protein [Sphingomonas yunnanensis]
MSGAVERIAARQVAAARARVAARLRALLPGTRIELVDDGVAVSGRGLVRRWLADPRLGWWRA